VADADGFRCTTCQRLFQAQGAIWQCGPAEPEPWFVAETEQWDAQAERYEASRANDPQYRSPISEALRQLALRPSDRVLDAACGTGLTSRWIAGRVAALTCLDASVQSLARMVRSVRPHPVLAVQGDLLQLPFADASFDAVLCSNALQQIPHDANRRRVIHELARVTRPGGRVVLTAHAFSRRKKRLGWSQENRATGKSGPVQYVYRLEADELSGMLAECLEQPRVRGAAFPLPYRMGLTPLSTSMDALARRLSYFTPWGEYLVGVGFKPHSQRSGE
jgi:SAM-dependent methyltransferase